MDMLVYIINLAFNIYIGIIVAQVAVSWLLAFDIINIKHPQAQNLVRLLQKATDPVYRPLRKYIPPIGGIDLSPLVVLLGLGLLRDIIIGILI